MTFVHYTYVTPGQDEVSNFPRCGGYTRPGPFGTERATTSFNAGGEESRSPFALKVRSALGVVTRPVLLHDVLGPG